MPKLAKSARVSSVAPKLLAVLRYLANLPSIPSKITEIIMQVMAAMMLPPKVNLIDHKPNAKEVKVIELGTLLTNLGNNIIKIVYID